MKKRILVLLSVVPLMVVMLAASVAPAFATQIWLCQRPDTGEFYPPAFGGQEKHLAKSFGYTDCSKI